MTRTIPSALQTQLAAHRTCLARCLKLDLRDETTLAITTMDEDLFVNLGSSPGDLYRADVGAIPSNIALAIGLEADNFEVRGPIGDVVTVAGVLGGRYHRARVRLFDVDFQDTSRTIPLLAGRVSAARVEAGEFVLEVRSATDAFNQTIGRVTSPQCSNDFGVFDTPRSYCQATALEWLGEVIAVSDNLQFTVAWSTSPAPSATDVRNGLITLTSGGLAGTMPVEVFDYDGAGVLQAYQPLAALPEVGDLLTVREGCDQTRPTCKLKGQILNFRGFPDMKGTDIYKYPIPGTDA